MISVSVTLCVCVCECVLFSFCFLFSIFFWLSCVCMLSCTEFVFINVRKGMDLNTWLSITLKLKVQLNRNLFMSSYFSHTCQNNSLYFHFENMWRNEKLKDPFKIFPC